VVLLLNSFHETSEKVPLLSVTDGLNAEMMVLSVLQQLPAETAAAAADNGPELVDASVLVTADTVQVHGLRVVGRGSFQQNLYLSPLAQSLGTEGDLFKL
jgi:hypothetical protein